MSRWVGVIRKQVEGSFGQDNSMELQVAPIVHQLYGLPLREEKTHLRLYIRPGFQAYLRPEVAQSEMFCEKKGWNLWSLRPGAKSGLSITGSILETMQVFEHRHVTALVTCSVGPMIGWEITCAGGVVRNQVRPLKETDMEALSIRIQLLTSLCLHQLNTQVMWNTFQYQTRSKKLITSPGLPEHEEETRYPLGPVSPRKACTCDPYGA